jgi:hypothetical protein
MGTKMDPTSRKPHTKSTALEKIESILFFMMIQIKREQRKLCPLHWLLVIPLVN